MIFPIPGRYKYTVSSHPQLPDEAAEWCLQLSLSHPHRELPVARRWARGRRVAALLQAMAQRLLQRPDPAARGLLARALAHDHRGGGVALVASRVEIENDTLYLNAVSKITYMFIYGATQHHLLRLCASEERQRRFARR